MPEYLSGDTKDRIKQARMNALCAKNIRINRQKELSWKIWAGDILTLVLPIIFFVSVIWSSSSPWKTLVEFIGFGVSAFLLIIGIFKVVGQWEHKVKKHSKYVAENISVKNETDRILTHADTFPEELGLSFLQRVEMIDKEDTEDLGDVSKKEKRNAYREALIEVEPRNATPQCPSCGANPWQYKPGNCQMCGNTPISKENAK